MGCSEPSSSPSVTPYWVFEATAEFQSDEANLYERCGLIVPGLLDGRPIPSHWEGTARVTMLRTRVRGGQIALDTMQTMPAVEIQWQKRTDGSASMVFRSAGKGSFSGAATEWGATGNWECTDSTVAGGEGRRIQGRWSLSALYPID